MKYLLGVLCLMVILGGNTIAGEVPQEVKSWPTIRATQVSMRVTSENSKVILDIFSEDNPVEILYKLRCNKGDAVDRLEIEDEYYGMFQCHLIDMKGDGPELLIGENNWNYNKTSNTRGVFTYEQLVGPCKSDPEFGFKREFYMRGMKLRLSISNFNSPPVADVITGKVQLTYTFYFEAKVMPDKYSTSKYTSPSAKKYCGGYYKVNDKGEAIYHEYNWPSKEDP